MIAWLILSLVIVTNASPEDTKVTGEVIFSKPVSNEAQCKPRCDQLFAKSPSAVPRTDAWFSCYRGCRLSVLLNKTDDKTKKRITNTCDKVCSEVYNKTTLEKACQIGCSFDAPINLKKKPQQKTQPSVHKRKGNPKLITVPVTKDTSDSNSFPSPFIPWTLRYFSSKSQFNEEDADVNSKEKQILSSPDLQQQPLPDFMSFPRDPLGILSKLFRPSFFLPDSDSVKITRSTVTVFGGNGDNEIQVLRSDSSKPDTIERTIISPSMEWTTDEFPTETLKKPVSPSTEKSQLLLPRPTMHLSDVISKNQTDKKHRDDLLAFTIWETFGNMLFIAIIFVLVGIWAAMFRHSWITNRDYTAVSTSDPDVMMKEDIDDELGYLGFQVNRRLARNDDLLTFAPLQPPTYEETQKNKPNSILRVALDASTSTRDDDRVLHQDC